MNNIKMQECDYDLVAPMQVSEVWETMKGMRGGSAPGIDGISTALWKGGRVWLLPVIAGMVSGILNIAEWPLSWAMSVLVPLFKKGDRLDHGNYRGISLSNVLSKVFAKILCCRIDNWIDQNRILSDLQAGFRKGYSPIDQIFILLGMIRKQVSRKEGRLFVAFLDLKWAFDGVDRSLMIESLLALGLPSAFVKIIASMYNIVKIVVRVGKDFSRVIRSRLGVKQGCTISPRLFSLYINDFEEYLIDRGAPKIKLSSASVMALLFADDIALVGESKEYLQQLLGNGKTSQDSRK